MLDSDMATWRSAVDFVFRRLSTSLVERENARHFDTNEEGLRMSLTEMSRTLTEYIQRHDTFEPHPRDRGVELDSAVAFWLSQAKRYQKRGTPFDALVGLMKMIRQSYVDFMSERGFPEEDGKKILIATHRFFDTFELEFWTEWFRCQDTNSAKRIQDTKQSLPKGKDHYSTIFKEMAEPVFVVDKEMRLLEANEALLKFFGISNAELSEKKCFEVFQCGLCEQCPLKEAIRSNSSFCDVEITIKADDDDKTAVMNGYSFDGVGARCAGGVAIFQNITERKQSESVQREDTNRYRSLFMGSPISMWEKDFSELKKYLDALRASGVNDFLSYFENHPEEVVRCVKLMKLLDTNSVSLELLGAKNRKELLAGMHRVIPKDETGVFCSALAALAEGHLNILSEETVQKFTGEKMHVIIHVGVVPGYERSLGRVLVSLLDITDRKVAEDSLREREEQYRAIFDSTSDALLVVDLQENIVEVNPQACKMYGYSRAEFVRLSGKDIVHPDYLQRAQESIKELKAGGEWQTEAINVKKDGTLINVEARGAKFDYKGKKHFLGIVRDITERKRMEQALLASRDELRSLSSHLQTGREEERKNIAHEIQDELGHSLAALKMDLSWLGSKLSASQAPLLKKSRAMSKLVDRTIHTVRRISSDLRPESLDDLGLGAAIEWEARKFQNRTGIECVTKVDPNMVMPSPSLSTAVFRIFQETLANIMDEDKVTRLGINLQAKDGKIILRVRDDGMGITKGSVSDSRCIGLVGIRERAYHWGGKVIVDASKGPGSTITVTIPYDDKQKDVIKILVADDHTLVREGLKQILGEVSDIIVCGEAQEEKEVIEEVLENDYDVVLMDISIPGGGGIDVLRQIRTKKPTLPILVLSMHVDAFYAMRTLQAGASGYLTKESAPDELIAAIRKVSVGRKYISASVAERLASDLHDGTKGKLHRALSEREYEVMSLIAAGKTGKEIASQLSLSIKTVSTYRARVLGKMKMKNNSELMRYALSNHIV